jgi:arylsulfatase A-like enzyme
VAKNSKFPQFKCHIANNFIVSSKSFGHKTKNIRMRTPQFIVLLLAIAFPFSALAAPPPNVILIVADDMGYADMSCQGTQNFKTPNLDRMAAEGTRFTSFYVAQAVCTASRAALLTGCYPNRVGLQGALNHTSKNGIADEEWLLPEMFKARGYATGAIGKWHLGTTPKFNPRRHGFDEWFGIPYSNDNSKYHPVLAKEMPPLPMYDGEKIIETDPDQSQFTKRITQRAVDFMQRNSTRPFFLYVPYIMPHVPIFASEKFKGRSGGGLYGDVMEEIDWSVGEILNTLRTLKIDQQTLIIFISDNGPFLSYGDHAGSARPLREGKLTTFEGGVRVPCIVRWPDKVPARRISREPFMAIDWVPTFVELIDGKAPEKKIDGRSIKPLLFGERAATSPHEAYFFYSDTELQAVRSGPWKLHFAHPYLTVMAEPGHDGKPSGWGKQAAKSIEQSGVSGIASRHGYRVEQLELSLFNLEADPGETRNLAAKHPDIIRRLTNLAAPIRRELGDSLQNIKGSETREVGTDTAP